MSEEYKIVDYQNRRTIKNVPYTVGKAIVTESGTDLPTHIANLNRTMNEIFEQNGGEDLVDVSNYDDGLGKDEVIVDGEKRDIVTTRDYTGKINYPKTHAKAIIMAGDSDNSLEDELERLEQRIEALDGLLNPFKIESFTINGKNQYNLEIGSEFPKLNIAWTYNKRVKEQKLKLNSINLGEVILNPDPEMDKDELGPRSYSIDKLGQTVMEQKSFPVYLNALGRDSLRREVTASINFLNYIYYGAFKNESLPKDALAKLSKVFAKESKGDFGFNCGPDVYGYILVPSRFAKPAFRIFINEVSLGFGGFRNLGEIDITNSKGFKEKYTVYRTVNMNLGKITVKIS